MRTVLVAIVTVAFTDVMLQLDNALAVSSVASAVPSTHRTLVLAAGVLLSSLCLLGFTIAGSALIHRLEWLKPIAGLVLVGIGVKLALDSLLPLLGR